MRRFFLALTLTLAIAASACSPAQRQVNFTGTDISGADFAKSFQLTDHTGQSRTLDDFKGKLVVLFFGYTHCPDVCPTTMADTANAMKMLGKDSEQVQVLFVTLDPERDTQAVLAKFVPSFDSRFIGLYGTVQQTAETAQNFKVYYAKQAQKTSAGEVPVHYSIDHSAGSYVFDTTGKVRVYLKYGMKPAEIAGDLKQLM